jgi:hypothetical protein
MGSHKIRSRKRPNVTTGGKPLEESGLFLVRVARRYGVQELRRNDLSAGSWLLSRPGQGRTRLRSGTCRRSSRGTLRDDDKEVLGLVLHPHPGAVTHMNAMASAGQNLLSKDSGLKSRVTGK